MVAALSEQREHGIGGEVLAVLDSYGSVTTYFASFPDAHAASADMRRRFRFLGDTGVWRLLISAARDIGG